MIDAAAAGTFGSEEDFRARIKRVTQLPDTAERAHALTQMRADWEAQKATESDRAASDGVPSAGVERPKQEQKVRAGQIQPAPSGGHTGPGGPAATNLTKHPEATMIQKELLARHPIFARGYDEIHGPGAAAAATAPIASAPGSVGAIFRRRSAAVALPGRHTANVGSAREAESRPALKRRRDEPGKVTDSPGEVAQRTRSARLEPQRNRQQPALKRRMGRVG